MTDLQTQNYNDLKDRYGKATLSKTEMAQELGISYSTIDSYISKGMGIPAYKKLGTAKNAKVVFNIVAIPKT